ncbi:unnamed protein product [Brassica oleracea var. botrytis]
MASHHHLDCDCRRLHHRESNPHIPAYYTTSSPCFCADSTPCCTQCSPPDLDHLLRLIASYLQNQQPCCETASTRFNAVKRQRFVNQQNTQREYENTRIFSGRSTISICRSTDSPLVANLTLH